MRELSDSFERITHIPREREIFYFVKFFKKQERGGQGGGVLGSRDAFKKTLRIYSLPPFQKCTQTLWETNAARRCNHVKQYAILHFPKTPFFPMWIFKSSFSRPVFETAAQKI